MRIPTVFLMAGVVLILTSCGPGHGMKLARVSGKVTYKGEPLQNRTIMFAPDDSQGTTGPQAVGSIHPDGTYILSTTSPGDGALVGFHQVGILGLETEPISEEAMPNPEDDPLKYLATKDAAAKQAGQARVMGETQTVTGLDGKTYRVVVPEKLTNPRTSGVSAQVSRGSNTINIDIQEDGSVTIN